MKNIKYIILGSAITIALFSLIENFVELIMLWIEVWKIKPSLKILNYQKDIQVIKEFIKQPEEMGDYVVDYDDEDD